MTIDEYLHTRNKKSVKELTLDELIFFASRYMDLKTKMSLASMEFFKDYINNGTLKDKLCDAILLHKSLILTFYDGEGVVSDNDKLKSKVTYQLL